MEKEFVPYEQALALKELGFDGKCGACYYKKFDNEIGYHKVYRDFNFVQLTVSAPTFSQAFRWFRENYGLKHHIWAGKISTVFYGYDILNIDEQEFVVNNTTIGGGDCDFETYEEAELACLDKLIELTFKSE